MKIKVIGLLFLAVLVSCMQPIPRKPVTVKTTSFMEASVSLNKALNENEEKAFYENEKHNQSVRPFGIDIHWLDSDLKRSKQAP